MTTRYSHLRGERSFAISDLAAFYKDRTVGEVLRMMRCTRGCGSGVLAAWRNVSTTLIHPGSAFRLGSSALTLVD